MSLQIVPSVYGGVGMMDGTVPRGDPQPHLGSNPNVSSSPFLVNGGHALPMYTATPFQDQTVTAYGGLHFQGGPYQHPSQSYAEPYHGPTHTPKVPGPVSRARGHAKGRVQQKHAVAPAQDPKLGAPSFSQTQLLPLKAPAPVLPPPKGVTCELCKVECNTLEVLQQHVNGKKHMKKLKVFEELQNLSKKVLSVQPEQAPTTELKPELVSQPDRVEGSRSQQLHQEAPPSQEINTESTKVAGEKRKAEEVEPSEESGKMMRVDGPENSRRGPKHKLKGSKGKKKKTKPSKGLVQASKPKEVTPLVCELCDVKCESVVVFQSHLAGKKHRLKAKCFLQGQETFGLEQRPVIQAVDQNNAGASTFVSFQLVDQGFGVAAVQNGNVNSGHGSTLGDNTRSSEVEAISTINQT